MAKTKVKAEFGDFQTPSYLAEEVADLLREIGVTPRTILEPNCGRGAFVFAAAKAFPNVNHFLGADINKKYLEEVKNHIKISYPDRLIQIHELNFFTANWTDLLKDLPDPLLIIGNPPWVTNAELKRLDSENLPAKHNFKKWKGFEALTGKSNFDISEWMLLQQLAWLQNRAGHIAMLVKQSVARKVLTFAWKNDFDISDARIYTINAQKHFGAAVDACLFYLASSPKGSASAHECAVYESLSATFPVKYFGNRQGLVISDVEAFDASQQFFGHNDMYQWRSGIKHDASKVMELKRVEDSYINGLGERLGLEEKLIYPLMKSSDVANPDRKLSKYVIVTQKKVGQDTSPIADEAPKTWQYLLDHHEHLAKRKSSIYKGKPDYSIFGVGDYSFAPWKVAISGFYNQSKFRLVGPFDNKPVMFDDTIYFLPCCSKEEGELVVELLNSQKAQNLINSMIFWGDKRPITADLLKRINISALAKSAGLLTQLSTFHQAKDSISIGARSHA